MTKSHALGVAAALLLLPVGAGIAATSPEQPYAGLEQRDIKALSESAIDDYLNGRGMSLALAAELNGYPGPTHVLDLAGPLRLTAGQARETEALFRAMRAEAVDLGRQIVEAEADLDRLFADSTADEAAIAAATGLIGALTGTLRAVHLRTHVAMRDLLTAEQVAAYNHLRGYAGPTGVSGAEDSHGGHGGHR